MLSEPSERPLEPGEDASPLDPVTGAAVGPTSSRAGRNLPVAIGVGVLLLVAVAASLWFRPEPFVAVAAVAVGAALWELRQAFARRDIHLPIRVRPSG